MEKSRRRTSSMSLRTRIALGHSPILFYIVPILFFLYVLKYYIQTRYSYYIPVIFEFIGTILLSFVLVLILTPLVMKLARKFDILDKSNPKKGKIPLLGGLSIYLVFFVIAYYFQPWTVEIKAIICASTVIAIVGTIDDIVPLSSFIRLIFQLIASMMIITAGIKFSFFPATWWGEALAVFVTLFWILGIVNATNFIDGVDGLASGFAVIASTFFFLVSLHMGQPGMTLLTSIIIGCGIGFLFFNFKPAKMYLGDGGSTFLGFLLASLAIYGKWSAWNFIIASAVPILILSVLIFDMIYITISRIKNGQVRNIREWLDYRGDDHFHHRLIHLGFNEKAAVIFIYLVTVIMGLSALIIGQATTSFPVVVSLIQAVLFFINVVILMLVGRKMSNDTKKT